MKKTMKKMTELDRIKKNVKKSVYEEVIVAIKTKIGRNSWDEGIEEALLSDGDEDKLAVFDDMCVKVMMIVAERNNFERLGREHRDELVNYAMRLFGTLVWTDFRHLCLDYYDINAKWDIYEFMYKTVCLNEDRYSCMIRTTRDKNSAAEEMKNELIRVTKMRFKLDLLLDSARHESLNDYIEMLAEGEYPIINFAA